MKLRKDSQQAFQSACIKAKQAIPFLPLVDHHDTEPASAQTPPRHISLPINLLLLLHQLTLQDSLLLINLLLLLLHQLTLQDSLLLLLLLLHQQLTLQDSLLLINLLLLLLLTVLHHHLILLQNQTLHPIVSLLLQNVRELLELDNLLQLR